MWAAIPPAHCSSSRAGTSCLLLLGFVFCLFSVCCCPGQWGDLPARAGHPFLHLPFLPLLWLPKGLVFWLWTSEDFCSKPNGVFWETTHLSNINAVGDPERKVILALENWELIGNELWGGGILLNGQISALSIRFLRDLKMSCVDCFRFLLLHV